MVDHPAGGYQRARDRLFDGRSVVSNKHQWQVGDLVVTRYNHSWGCVGEIVKKHEYSRQFGIRWTSKQENGEMHCYDALWNEGSMDYELIFIGRIREPNAVDQLVAVMKDNGLRPDMRVVEQVQKHLQEVPLTFFDKVGLKSEQDGHNARRAIACIRRNQMTSWR